MTPDLVKYEPYPDAAMAAAIAALSGLTPGQVKALARDLPGEFADLTRRAA